MAGGRPAGRTRARFDRRPHNASAASPAGEQERADHPLAVRVSAHLVGGKAGRALAAAQGRALAALLARLGGVEVGQGAGVSS